jgi:hypothetical protein
VSAALREVLETANAAGYDVRRVELEGLKLDLVKRGPVEKAPEPPPKLPEETDEAWKTRSAVEIAKMRERDAHIKRLTPELGPRRATQFVDQCLQSGGIVP